MELVKVILLIGVLLLAGCSEKGQSIPGENQAISGKNGPVSEKTISEETINENKVDNESQYGDLPSYNPEKKIQMDMPTSITLEYPYKGPSLSIFNSGKDTFMVDPEYRIEKETSGGWQEVSLPEGIIIFERESSYLEPGKAYHQKIEFFLDTKTVEEGTYRVIKVLHPKEGGEESIVLADEYQVSAVEKYSETGYIIDITDDDIWLINDPQVETEGKTRGELRKE